MLLNKECIAMILAGGQGSRLYALTNKIAKPAVPFGGKYRIIDFTLSNCINSGIDTVGVLTQYQPLVLNEYIGTGQPWDLDRTYGGVHILPPYQAKNRTDWYKGTANAIYQNMHFMDRYDPEYVVILSGDHIYKMNYDEMLRFHKQKNADCTIAVIEVPIKEASRFGIMNADADMKITEFEEKPKQPKSNKASMGIYIFSKEVLFDYLEKDNEDKNSSNDFGKNIIPSMLAAGKKMYAYPFKGYWKDVGTIDSLWEANMDLIGEHPAFDLYDHNWVIHSRNPIVPPHYIEKDANVVNSLISGGCYVRGSIENSLIGNNVKIGKNAVIRDSVIFSDVVIEDNAVIDYSIIDEHVVVGSGAKVGGDRVEAKGITVIGRDMILKKDSAVQVGAMIEKQEEVK